MLPGILPLSALRAVSSPMTRPDLPSIHSRPDHPHSVVVGWYAILPLLRRPDRKPWFAGCCSTRLQRPERVYWFHPQTQARHPLAHVPYRRGDRARWLPPHTPDHRRHPCEVRLGHGRAGGEAQVRGQRSEVRDQRSAVRGQRSAVRGQRSEISGQRSEMGWGC